MLQRVLVGADLRVLRAEAQLSTKQMAELAGLKSRKTFENWEKDVGAPNINQFIKLCLGCGFDPVALLDFYESRGGEYQRPDFTKVRLEEEGSM